MPATNVAGKAVISVHSKRTYALREDGRCDPVSREEQAPLIMRPITDSEGKEVFFETDVTPIKTATDLVVIASAHGGSARQMEVSIEVGSFRWACLVSGERRCSYSGPGTLRFSEPDPIGVLPLRYENAYGGVDLTVPVREPETIEDLLTPHPGLYPRNPVGKGYVVHDTKERLDGLELPNLEFPFHRLTPENLVAGDRESWWRQPLPWSCDWFEKHWYPRCAYLGVLPDFFPEDDHAMLEARAGWVEPGQKKRWSDSDLAGRMDERLFNAASPALAFPFLCGSEIIRLRGMTTSGVMQVRLPPDRPQMALRFNGRLYPIEHLVPHRILISLDEMGVSLVWHGTWLLPKQILDRLEPVRRRGTSTQAFPFEVFVDRELVQQA